MSILNRHRESAPWEAGADRASASSAGSAGGDHPNVGGSRPSTGFRCSTCRSSSAAAHVRDQSVGSTVGAQLDSLRMGGVAAIGLFDAAGASLLFARWADRHACASRLRFATCAEGTPLDLRAARRLAASVRRRGGGRAQSMGPGLVKQARWATLHAASFDTVLLLSSSSPSTRARPR